MNEQLLASLKRTSIATDLPQSQLLLACFDTAAGRKRRLPVRKTVRIVAAVANLPSAVGE